MNEPISWLAAILHEITQCPDPCPCQVDHHIHAAELWGHISERYNLKRPGPGVCKVSA